jgi:endonuclease/exonuclease/phosphatase family metal-dependent hydrolase
MKSRSTGSAYVFMKFLSWVLMVFMLLCASAPFVHPKHFWFMGFLSLLFPYSFVAVFLLLLYWVLKRSIFFIYHLLSLALCLYSVQFNFALHLPSIFKKEKSPEVLRLMSWNIRHFIPYNESNFKPVNKDQISKVFDAIAAYEPDVICFQEFISLPDEKEKNPFQSLKNKFDYSFHQFDGSDIFQSNQYSGTAIFSKYPIIHGGTVPFPHTDADNTEATVFADIVKGKDTIRVYSIHLQSFGFGNREYKILGTVKNDREDVRESKYLIKKMKKTFETHGAQADFLSGILKESPYPTIVAGDLNDVPGSYAYKSVREQHKDAFLEKGFFLGSTFTSSFSFLLKTIPTLRIDYIFHPQAFSTVQYKRGGAGISDHFFILADIQFPHNEGF